MPTTTNDSATDASKARYAAPALDKGLDILELLSKSEQMLTLNQISKQLGRSVNEIFRMVVTLEQRGYLLADINQLRSFGTASAFAAVVVFANYISGRDVTALYHQPRMLWMIMPMIILWLCRVWLLASRGELNEDPVVFALTDRTSLLIGAAVLIIALLAR